MRFILAMGRNSNVNSKVHKTRANTILKHTPIVTERNFMLYIKMKALYVRLYGIDVYLFVSRLSLIYTAEDIKYN